MFLLTRGTARNIARNRAVNNGANVYMILSIYQSANNGVIGVASRLCGVCERDAGARASITDYFRGDVYTAAVLAHEIGHLLGMAHDFRCTNPRNPSCIRYDSRGNRCTGINAVMDYTSVGIQSMF